MKKPPSNISDQLRIWRERRRLSQLELSLRANVSTRHLSFVETGRSEPGRELILRLSEELDIPFRERNLLLVSAGFAPIFQHRRYSDPSFDPVRKIIDLTLEKHRPFPAYAFNRHWNVVVSNAEVPELYEGVWDELVQPPINVIRTMLHPRGLAPRIVNLGIWWTHLTAQLRRQIELTADPTLRQLLQEVSSYPAAQSCHSVAAPYADVVIPLRIRTSIGELSLIGATTVFGTPADITVEEIALETLYPADAVTDQAVRDAAMRRNAQRTK